LYYKVIYIEGKRVRARINHNKFYANKNYSA